MEPNRVDFFIKQALKRAKSFNELVAFKHSIFSLPFIFIAMIVAAQGWFGIKLLALGILATLSARNFAMTVNRLLDRDIDIKNERTKDRPSVDGSISLASMYFFILLNGSIFILVAYLINSLAFMLSPLFLAILALYSYMKRVSSIAHLFLGLSLALAPIAGVIAVSETIHLWTIFLSLGVLFWVAGFDLLYSLQDMEFDKKEGLYSIPSIYGKECSLFISRIFHSLAPLFWLFFILDSEILGLYALIGLGVCMLMLLYQHYLVRENLTKIDRAFFVVNGYLSIVFFIFIALDFIL